MPGKMVECPSCTKIMRSDNLKRHKNSCKVARQGCGILFTPASSGVVPVRNRVKFINKHANDEGSTCSDESSVDEEESIDHIVADESDDEDDISESDGGCEEEDDFWFSTYVSTKTEDDDILYAFKGYLVVYTESRSDALYLKIMEDVYELESSSNMDFKQALAIAIVKNKEAIMFKISNSNGDDEEEFVIWSIFAEKQDEWGSCCKWWIGDHGCSKECPKISISKVLAWYAFIFHLMDKDTLVQEIYEIVEKSSDVMDGINLAVEKYRKAILAKYVMVKELWSDAMCRDRLKQHLLIRSVWNYIDAHE